MISARDWADAERLWEYQHMRQPPVTSQVAIGLGSHDIGVADVAAGLYLDGFAPLLVFSGANGPTTRARMPRGEAEHYRERAIDLGVPADVILVEERARNTGENIRFSRALLERRGPYVSSALLVSKPYEERRANATARKLWPEVQWVSASANQTLAEYVEGIGDARLVLDMLVGAHQRLLIYPDQGFAVPVDVPLTVDESFQRLCSSGFTGRLAAV